MVTSFFHLGKHTFIKDVYPIITSPGSDPDIENPPSDGCFVNSFWIYLVVILISNFCVFINSSDIKYLILTCSFVQGGLTT